MALREKLFAPKEIASSENLTPIVSFLRKSPPSPQNNFYEFSIDPDRNPLREADLRSLITLPFEVVLFESSGKLVLVTGGPGEGLIEPEHRGLIRSTALFAHSHDYATDSNWRWRYANPFPIPSVKDIQFLGQTGTSVKNLLVHAYGILEYGHPSVNPITGEKIDVNEPIETIKIFSDYLQSIGFNYVDTTRERVSIWDLSVDDNVRICTEFLSKARMVRKAALWDDAANMQSILDLINLHK